MKLVIHGNDLSTSRNFLLEQKNKVKNPVNIEGENLTYEKFFQASENKTLFEDKISIFIENFFSKNKTSSPEFKKIISYINGKNDLDIVFWEPQELGKSAPLFIKNVTVKNFSFPQGLFLFLDNIRPGNYQYSIKLFHQLLKNSETEIIFFMLIRQFRILSALSGMENKNIDEINRLAPWQISKFRQQLMHFQNDELSKIYNKLFNIELSHKTGKVPYSLEKSIDFFLLDL